ncbi:MAG: UDP-N-acetylmuramoyl-tripeptide--D-alanyl-D-alanine ligase [Brevinematales bacterium]|nr:UDP-N-acetylmuramoyl-tripeptide--D-alanyl-D-alanine ligase [Brevinematales bacterium]
MLTPDFITESLNVQPVIIGEIRKDISLKISIDSREIDENSCFLAIKGERFDGHNFVKDCVNKGVKYFILNKKYKNKIKENGYFWFVKDNIKALGQLAKKYKNEIFANSVAITGSSGKTTTRELIVSILSKKYNIHTAKKNFNNEIGLPLTILEAKPETHIFVLELGMNHRGEIHRLSKIVSPFASVITNIGYAHIGNLGSRENIAKAKAEIFDGMNKGGYAFLNKDDDFYEFLKKISPCEVIDFSIKDIQIIENKGIDGFTIDYKGEKIEFSLPGFHNISNLAAALKVAEFFNVDPKNIAEAIKNFKPVKGRNEVVKGKITLINDAYNANPASMKASLLVLSSSNKGRKIAVLSDMLELGKYEVKLHEELGEWINTQKPCETIFCYGKLSKIMADKIKNIKVFWFDNKEKMIEELKSFVQEGDIILFKASHSMGLEEVFDRLRSFKSN